MLLWPLFKDRPMWLTEKELERLTRRKRPSAQAQVLREAGIPYRRIDAIS